MLWNTNAPTLIRNYEAYIAKCHDAFYVHSDGLN